MALHWAGEGIWYTAGMGIATKLNYTPEDLLSMPDRGRYELIDGQLLERNVSSESSMVALILNARLIAFVLANKLGWMVQADGGLQIFPDTPGKVRFGDGAFISKRRMPERPGAGHLRAAPELVVEVVSPNDTAEEVDEKNEEYLRAGVLRVWVVYPATRSVTVIRPGGNETRLTSADMLSGEDVLPGFEVPVADLFDF